MPSLLSDKFSHMKRIIIFLLFLQNFPGYYILLFIIISRGLWVRIMKSQLVPPLTILLEKFQLDGGKSSLMNLSYKKSKNLHLVTRTSSYLKKKF
jgi:hypothetical protein